MDDDVMAQLADAASAAHEALAAMDDPTARYSAAVELGTWYQQQATAAVNAAAPVPSGDD